MPRFTAAAVAGLVLIQAAIALFAPAVAQRSAPPAQPIQGATLTASEEARADAVVATYPDFAGAVLAVREGEVVFRKAYGMAHRELSVPNTPSTKFRVGSNTKPFTAFAILQLAEAGKLSLDDPASKYYVAAPEAWSKITLKHLLSHSSGIPDYNDVVEIARLHRSVQTPALLIGAVRDKPLDFPPGSRFGYSNTGYVILGLAIEHASGQTYAQYLARNIFEPLGMKDTGYADSSTLVPNQAAGYLIRPAGGAANAFTEFSYAYSAGGIYSTVDDMLIWDQALASRKLLSQDSYRAMWTDQGFGYGYGWRVGQQYGRPRIYHSGGVTGFSSFFTRYPDDRVSVVVLSNVNYVGSVPQPIAERIAAIYLRVPERKAVAGGEAVLRKFIEGIRAGAPDYDLMAPSVAATTRAQLAVAQAQFNIGDIRTITLLRADLEGRDHYRVDGTSGVIDVAVRLSPDLVVLGVSIQRVPPGATAPPSAPSPDNRRSP